MEKVIQLAIKTDYTVLITGPTGTGKSTLAQKIHDQSRRKNSKFVSVNLATLHEGTLEAELFGCEKGAFTGADRKRQGRFELANGGTVFLDEIGELSLPLQARLLEFLHSKKITPMGSNEEKICNARIIVATHKNLSDLVKKGLFREDLFHRLRVLSIELKTIAERSDEFGEIFHECLEDVCKLQGKEILSIHPAVAEKCESYSWPGNYRELRHVLEYAVASCFDGEIKLKDLPQWLLSAEKSEGIEASLNPTLGVVEVPLSLDFQKTRQLFEKEYLKRALIRFRGKINQTSRMTGISKGTLCRRMRSLGLKEGFSYELMNL